MHLHQPNTAAFFHPGRDLLNQPGEDLTQEDRDMASKVAALLLIGLICFEFVTAEIAVDCCLRVESEKRLYRRNLVSYTIQRAGEGCKISATVFVNRRNMKLCVVPPEGNPGVQKIIDYLDKKRQSHQ